MISISNKKISYITKIGLGIFGIYVLGFFAYKTAQYFKIASEKEELLLVLQDKKNEIGSLKIKTESLKKKIEILEKQYLTKEEMETRVKDIFERMSILDYNLKYLDSKKMCIDRYIIVAEVSAQSEQGMQAALGILSYVGNIKKHEANDSIYFVDYIAKPREVN